MKKVWNRIKIIWFCFKLGFTTDLMGFTVFSAMNSLMELIIKVGKDGTPMMTKLAVIVCNQQNDIATIWVGKGANASPYDRIMELNNEITELKHQLNKAIEENQ